MPPSFSSLQGARFGSPVHADVASGPWASISASIPVRVRSLRDSVCASAPDPEDSHTGSGIDCCLSDCRNSQSDSRVEIWRFFLHRTAAHLKCTQHVEKNSHVLHAGRAVDRWLQDQLLQLGLGGQQSGMGPSGAGAFGTAAYANVPNRPTNKSNALSERFIDFLLRVTAIALDGKPS
jgi:hypothetical protein